MAQFTLASPDLPRKYRLQAPELPRVGEVVVLHGLPPLKVEAISHHFYKPTDDLDAATHGREVLVFATKAKLPGFE